VRRSCDYDLERRITVRETEALFEDVDLLGIQIDAPPAIGS
jgi:hypothetical protein